MLPEESSFGPKLIENKHHIHVINKP